MGAPTTGLTPIHHRTSLLLDHPALSPRTRKDGAVVHRSETQGNRRARRCQDHRLYLRTADPAHSRPKNHAGRSRRPRTRGGDTVLQIADSRRLIETSRVGPTGVEGDGPACRRIILW